MRPMDEVSRALLFAACALLRPERAATLAELAEHAGVGKDVARRRLDYLRRAEHLCIVRERRVPYRNRPVAEYSPAPASAPRPAAPLSALAAAWAA